MLPYEEKITTDKDKFLAKLSIICQNLGIKPEWLMICMAIESAKTFLPNIQNASTGATGLIQFMPSTAKDLGTTCDTLKGMKNYEQLDWVYKYFKPWTGKMRSFTDVYLVIFYPMAVGKPDSYPLGLTPEQQHIIAKYNPAYDINKDGMIQKSEIKEIVSKFIPAAWKDKV